MEAHDETWMLRALELAERGRGLVEPNPLVGAVIVREGQVVGEGWHRKFGDAHAEVNALAMAGETARGATLYVTLEPCCHFGKTPPCTDAILRAGIGRVVAATQDPFPQVAGQGAAMLQAGGIAVEFGVCEQQARRLNGPYLKLLAVGKPYVHGKWAMTLDGKICTRTGDSRWISNEASRRRVHELRGRMDAIIVGIGTALADDPLLTARPPGPRTACRVIFDSRGRLPRDSQLVRTASAFPTLVVTGQETPAESVDRLRTAGCEVLSLPADAEGQPAVSALLDEMGRRCWTNVLVEGGAAVLASFLDRGALDEVHVFLGPHLVGGSEAKSAIGGRGARRIAEGLKLCESRVEVIEGDVYVQGWVYGY